MKKILSLTIIALFSANMANAQLSDILNKVSSATASATQGNSTLSSLTGIISSKLIPSSTQILGTWAYQEPAVMFTSSNALKSAAGAVASSSIESKLQSYLSKAGIKKGNLTITFDSDKNFAIKKSGKTVRSGTYTISGNDITLTFKGKSKPCKVTPQLDNGSLVIVMDATTLKTFLTNVAGNFSSLSTITSLLNSYDGMKLGIRMSKQ